MKSFMKVLVAGAAVTVAAFGAKADALTIDRDMTLDNNYSPADFAGDYTLTVNAARCITGALTSDGHQATVRIENGGELQVGNFAAKNGGYLKVEFNGGWLKDAGGWGSGWCVPDATSTIELASVNGNTILIPHPVSQWKYLNMGAGRVFTSGSGRLEIATAGISGTTILKFVLNVNMNNYQHTGGTLLRGNVPYGVGWVAFNSDYSLPQGLVELGSANGHLCYLCLEGTTQQAEKIKGYGRSCITNMTATASTLVFKADGSYLDAAINGAAINVTKDGAGTTFTMKTAKVPGTFLVANGTAVVQKPSTGEALTTVDKLTLTAAGTLRIDGVTLQVGTFEDQGGTLECVNGGKLQYLTTDGSRYDSDTMPWSGCNFVKAGAGSAFFCSANALKFRSLQVAEGVMSLAGKGDRTTNKFWRFTVKSAASANTVLHLSPMRLYDANGAYCDGGSAAGGSSQTYTMHFTSDANAPAIKDLQPLHMLISGNATAYAANQDVSGNCIRPPWVMFTASTVYTCQFTSLKPVVETPSSWLVIAYRIPDNANAVAGYDLRSAWTGTTRYPGTWVLESSPTGEDGTWEVIDEKSGQIASSGQTWYHGGANGNASTSPYPITVMNDQGGGFNPAMNVQVDGGATLDCTQCAARQTLAAITVDVALGGGTLKNVQLAATGKLNLTNYSGKSGYELPLAFVDSVTTGSLSGWEVYVNGELKSNYGLAWQNGKLVVPRTGLMVYVK